MDIWLWILLLFILILIIGITGIYLWISHITNPYIFDSTETLLHRQTALLLGTAKLTKRGQTNFFFANRITTSSEVYNKDIINHILVSGANKPSSSSDEVDDMVQALLELKISPKSILTDQKGLRTWASVWRCKNTYHIADPLIISQRFHNQRAVFIALKLGMHPIAVNAAMVKGKAGVRMLLREALARVKCLLDCYLFKPEYP